MKNDYRRLRDTRYLSADDRVCLNSLTQELEDLPDWSDGIAGQTGANATHAGDQEPATGRLRGARRSAVIRLTRDLGAVHAK